MPVDDGGAADAAGRRPQDREPRADPRAPRAATTSASTRTCTASRTGSAGCGRGRRRRPSRRSTRSTHRRWWPLINLYLVTWGQNVCRPVYPLCPQCVLVDICPKIGVTKVGKVVKAECGGRTEGDAAEARGVRFVAAWSSCSRCRAAAQQKSPGAGPVIVLETVKGDDRVRDLSRGSAEDRRADRRAREEELLQRAALPSRRAELRVQVGDPATRDMSRAGVVGTAGQRQADRRRGNHEEAPATCSGAVAMAYPGTRRAGGRQPVLHPDAGPRPELDGKYTVFGQVIKGMDVVDEDPARRRAQDERIVKEEAAES